MPARAWLRTLCYFLSIGVIRKHPNTGKIGKIRAWAREVYEIRAKTFYGSTVVTSLTSVPAQKSMPERLYCAVRVVSARARTPTLQALYADEKNI